MSNSTITLQDTINQALAFGYLQPVTGVGGVANNPALTIANRIKMMIQSPRFAWETSRSTFQISGTSSSQDYTKTVTDFGWLESASYTDINSATHVLDIKWEGQPPSSESAAPSYINTFMDNGTGDIVFRLNTVPDANITITCVYQIAPTLFTTTADTWTPIPDKMADIYIPGFNWLYLFMCNDPRSQLELQMFTRNLFNKQQGLNETQKQEFLQDAIAMARATAGELNLPPSQAH